MEILFLGTSCAIPTASNGSTSFLVRNKNLLVLVDVSDNPIKSMLKGGVNPLDLDVVVLTHYHADHLSGYPALVSTFNCMGRKRKLIVITDSVTATRAREVLTVFDLKEDAIGFKIFYIDELSYEGFGVNLTPGYHTVPTSMVRFEEKSRVIFYTADTAYTPMISKMARGCDLLIHEATYSKNSREKPEGHSSAYEAGKSARDAGAKELYLCHLCFEEYEDSEAPVREAREVYGGKIKVPELFTWYRV